MSCGCKKHINLKDYAARHIGAGVDSQKPGIYLWRIERKNCYVGRYTLPNRPLDEYSNNVRKICYGLPYRKSKPDQFRRIHHALHQALHDNKEVVVVYLENVLPELLNKRERFWIEILEPTFND